MKKIDRVKVMVTHFFPNESPECQAELVAGILNQKVEDFSETPEMILQLTAAVGQDEAKGFSKVRKDAIDELQTEALQAKKLRQNREEPGPPRKPVPAEPATGDEPPGPSAGVDRVPPRPAPRASKTKAPEEFVSLLPSVPYLVFQMAARASTCHHFVCKYTLQHVSFAF